MAFLQIDSKDKKNEQNSNNKPQSLTLTATECEDIMRISENTKEKKNTKNNSKIKFSILLEPDIKKIIRKDTSDEEKIKKIDEIENRAKDEKTIYLREQILAGILYTRTIDGQTLPKQDLEKAIGYFEKAFQSIQRIGNHGSVSSQYLADVCRVCHNVYSSLHLNTDMKPDEKLFLSVPLTDIIKNLAERSRVFHSIALQMFDTEYCRTHSNMGTLYDSQKNFKDAFEYFSKAAKADSFDKTVLAIAKCNLAICYTQGHGTSQDLNKAMKLCQEAITCDPQHEQAQQLEKLLREKLEKQNNAVELSTNDMTRLGI